MIEVQVTKETERSSYLLGNRYSMSVSINKTLAVQRLVNDCLVREVPQEYIIDQLVGDITNSFRDELRLQVAGAMSQPVKQVWSN